MNNGGGSPLGQNEAKYQNQSIQSPESAMLKPPEHQVAGHSAGAGQLGPLIDGKGLFYKPFQQGDDRGVAELEFYETFSALTTITKSVTSFFPSFHGTKDLPSTDSSNTLLPHLILGDLFAGYENPCVIDLKMGARTWYLESSEEYITKCLKKDRESTSIPLGFRISGLQVHNKSGIWKPDRKEVKKYTVLDARRVLGQFVSSNPDQINPDRSLASSVYGGSNGVLAQLRELKSWFEDQTIFHFYSSSILISYEKGGTFPKVKVVDFAHVVKGEGIIDHNFLGGLCSLIKCLSEILIDPEESEKIEAVKNE